MFPRSAAKKYGIPVSSFERYTKELRSVGLIELMKNDCLMQFAPNTYRFCMSWKAEVAPQFEGRK